ncbi:Crp/Fnr family transcriptional regulator [Microscilla marina]|nr:Crp/Fnr family transcriptional regulator [Microscilla marina]
MLDKAQNIPTNACDHCAFASTTTERKASFSDSRKEMIIRSNDFLFKEEQLAMGIFCVEAGTLLTLKQAESKATVLNVIKPGHILGTNAITSATYQYSVKGLTDAKVCFIPKPLVIKLMNEHLPFKLAIMKALCQEIEATQQKSLSLIYKSSKQRIATLLLEVADTIRSQSREKASIYFVPEEFAGLVGIAAKSLMKILHEFEQKQWVQCRKNQLMVLNANALGKLL